MLYEVITVLGRRKDLNIHPGLADLGDRAFIRQEGRGFDLKAAAVPHDDLVFNRGSSDNNIQVVLALQAFLDDLHMEHPQESAAETEIKRLV